MWDEMAKQYHCLKEAFEDKNTKYLVNFQMKEKSFLVKTLKNLQKQQELYKIGKSLKQIIMDTLNGYQPNC